MFSDYLSKLYRRALEFPHLFACVIFLLWFKICIIIIHITNIYQKHLEGLSFVKYATCRKKRGSISGCETWKQKVTQEEEEVEVLAEQTGVPQRCRNLICFDTLSSQQPLINIFICMCLHGFVMVCVCVCTCTHVCLLSLLGF